MLKQVKATVRVENDTCKNYVTTQEQACKNVRLHGKTSAK